MQPTPPPPHPLNPHWLQHTQTEWQTHTPSVVMKEKAKGLREEGMKGGQECCFYFGSRRLSEVYSHRVRGLGCVSICSWVTTRLESCWKEQKIFLQAIWPPKSRGRTGPDLSHERAQVILCAPSSRKRGCDSLPTLHSHLNGFINHKSIMSLWFKKKKMF